MLLRETASCAGVEHYLYLAWFTQVINSKDWKIPALLFTSGWWGWFSMPCLRDLPHKGNHMFFHVFHQKTLDRFGSIVEEIAPWLVAHNQPMMSRAVLAQDGTRHVLKTLLLSTSFLNPKHTVLLLCQLLRAGPHSVNCLYNMKCFMSKPSF